MPLKTTEKFSASNRKRNTQSMDSRKEVPQNHLRYIIMLTKNILSPHTLTILCTYQCTAACRQCCFESNPSIRGRLTKDTIIARIMEAKRVFSNLKLVVFSGGEALLLKNDLFASISYCTSDQEEITATLMALSSLKLIDIPRERMDIVINALTQYTCKTAGVPTHVQ